MKNIIVQLRIFRGKITYDAKGNITSDVQTMKLKFGRLEWVNFMKSARLVYSKVEVIKCTDMDNDYKEIEIPDNVISDVEKALKGEEVKLTPQQEIKELKEAVAKLTAKDKSKKEEKIKEEIEEKKPEAKVIIEEDDTLESLREEYTKLYGKKPSHLMREKGLRNKIAEKS